MRVVENVACTACGCVCDDLRITVDGDRIVAVGPPCALAEPWFLSQADRQPPAAEIDGHSVPQPEALDRAAAILRDARSPLFYGLSRSSTPGQRAAVALADHLGATIDTTASLCHAPSILALQHVGESTCSLGEIRNRADLVVFWGADPLRSHPRHLERYSADPTGLFVPGGRSDRTLVVIDVEATATSATADHFLKIAPGSDFEALWALRALIRGLPVSRPTAGGLPVEEWAELARRMTSCQCGVVFFGLGLSRTGLGHLNVDALLTLVRDLNDHTRFHARRMRIPGDVTGADSVLCWQTGFPFSVNLGRGYPRYNPGEFSADDVLARSEADACVLVGSEGVPRFSPEAIAHLREIPTIVLDHPPVVSAVPPTVRFTTAVYGIHRAGTAYRMDEIPIPLKGFVESPYPDDAEILTRIHERLG